MNKRASACAVEGDSPIFSVLLFKKSLMFLLLLNEMRDGSEKITFK